MKLAGKPKRTIPAQSVCFSSTSELLAAGTSDGNIKLWNLKKRNLVTTFSQGFDAINTVAWSSHDTVLAGTSPFLLTA